ncbi:hypothetical protein CYMTET_14448 [Cymbomonas tetramitiformis]|uniref:Uncharacterized protein n=1 Tax=Cymbomonas tetramitiformis TaxID=36881 RepID=A0AAE0GGA8_9CHLO|nr:hypothetical protein CYMTET_14448 [Cymbomonas tetramitiformis]
MHGKSARLGVLNRRGTAAAFCCPIDDDPEQLHALALCQIYQDAADEGQEAFAAVCGIYGALAVLGAGEAAPAIDYSVYGFTVGAQSRGAEEEDLLQGLDAMNERLDAVVDAIGFSATTASFVNDMNNSNAAGTRVTCPYGCCDGPECVVEGPPSPGGAPHGHHSLRDGAGAFTFAGGACADFGHDAPPFVPRPNAIPPFRYWQPEGYYWSLHTRGWAWHPGQPSHPQVVIPGFTEPAFSGAGAPNKLNAI